VKYYFYFMDDDKQFVDYMKTLERVGKVEDYEITRSLRLRPTREKMAEFFRCKCEICTGPEVFEPFCIVKDYKVVEGIRKVKCRGFIQNWVNPDPQSFGENHPNPEFPSFLELSKNGVRMKDRPLATPSRNTPPDYFNQWTDGAVISEVSPVDPALTARLNASLEQVRHKGGETPSPYPSNTFTVQPDE
jgi:hypothetical protein